MVRLLWRWTRRALLIVTALLIVAAVAGATHEWSAARRDMAAVPPPRRLIDVGGHRRESGEEVRTPRRRLSIPVVVVTGARGNEGTWRDLQLDQVRLSERGCQMIAENSGHAIPIQQPEAVVGAIRATVDAVRTRSAGPPCPASTMTRVK